MQLRWFHCKKNRTVRGRYKAKFFNHYFNGNKFMTKCRSLSLALRCIGVESKQMLAICSSRLK